ncbi:MAG: hypothetical protein DHS20C11_17030 [Lysobacteraceae bacterium]|nr:MAG: hypothetical protein DHS20C11_17030 [Xanthomonadaceae bacterium]
MSRFRFVGVSEHYESDLDYFSKNVLGEKLQAMSVNTNPDKPAGQAYQIDSTLRRKIKRYHRKDMLLYGKAVELRNARLRYSGVS